MKNKEKKRLKKLISKIDKKIFKSIKGLNYSSSVRQYHFCDGNLRTNTQYFSDAEIVTCIFKLEELRKKYVDELSDLKD